MEGQRITGKVSKEAKKMKRNHSIHPVEPLLKSLIFLPVRCKQTNECSLLSRQGKE